MKELNFCKYQGLGNDFIIFFDEDLPILDSSNLARAVCDRNFGIGADGMAIVSKSRDKWEMLFYNADGSEAPMCGNASRCVAAYLRKYYQQEEGFSLITKGALLDIEYVNDNTISVNVGRPSFNPKDVPINYNHELIKKELEDLSAKIELSALFMATSHSVIILDYFEEVNLEQIGREVENHSLFPKGVNVNFIVIENRECIRQKTWERGVGMTLACGTGASASVVIANKLGLVESRVKVKMDGGDLEVSIENMEVIMQGVVKEIANGKYFYEEDLCC